jgi:hypothetical protein
LTILSAGAVFSLNFSIDKRPGIPKALPVFAGQAQLVLDIRLVKWFLRDIHCLEAPEFYPTLSPWMVSLPLHHPQLQILAPASEFICLSLSLPFQFAL